VFNKWRKYSYAAQKTERNRVLKALAWLFSVFLAYALISTFLVYTVVIENRTMEPNIQLGDRLLVTPVAFSRLPFFAHSEEGGRALIKRGQIALVTDGTGKRRPAFLAFADSLIRFLTAQRIGLSADASRRFLKRVVALPGDQVSMESFVMRVRPADESYALTEFELSPRSYDLKVEAVPPLWDSGVPFSGHMDARSLGADEYFLVSDDRSNSNDSRTWGPVSSSAILGKAIFRYWPPKRIGRP